MRSGKSLLLALWQRDDGVAAVEFCITLPVLLMLTLGVYDVSRMIAARLDYQQAIAEVAGLAIAQPPQNDFTYLIDAMDAATDAPRDNISVSRRLHCNNNVMPADTATCGDPSDERAWYVSISVQGTFTPSTTHFGVGASKTISVTRTVRVQ